MIRRVPRAKLEVNWKRLYIGFISIGFGVFLFISVLPEYGINIPIDSRTLGNIVYVLFLVGGLIIRFSIKSKTEERHGS